jgi:hypothetical protein
MRSKSACGAGLPRTAAHVLPVGVPDLDRHVPYDGIREPGDHPREQVVLIELARDYLPAVNPMTFTA